MSINCCLAFYKELISFLTIVVTFIQEVFSSIDWENALSENNMFILEHDFCIFDFIETKKCSMALASGFKIILQRRQLRCFRVRRL